MIPAVDLFSCVGCHAIGLHKAHPIRTISFCEANPYRRSILQRNFPEIPIHDDVRTFTPPVGIGGIVVGGPPCQQTSVSAAIHGKRTGASLWRSMLRVGLIMEADWFVVEQPPGNAAWEAEVDRDLCGACYHTARVEFAASDCGAPYPRRRVFILASACLSRLEIAWRSIPQEIERAKRAADARGYWAPGQLRHLRVDAISAGEMDRAVSRVRRQRIEALGDSNPPIMMEVVGRSIALAEAAHRD